MKDAKSKELLFNDKVVIVKSFWNSYVELDFGTVVQVSENIVKVQVEDDIHTFKKSKKHDTSLSTRVIKIN